MVLKKMYKYFEYVSDFQLIVLCSLKMGEYAAYSITVVPFPMVTKFKSTVFT